MPEWTAFERSVCAANICAVQSAYCDSVSSAIWISYFCSVKCALRAAHCAAIGRSDISTDFPPKQSTDDRPIEHSDFTTVQCAQWPAIGSA